MRNAKAAARYAKSLLDLALEREQLDVVYEDMQLVARTISVERELRTLLNSPVVKADKKVGILNAIFAGKLGELSQKFIAIVAMKKREYLLGGIALEFIDQVKKHKGIVTVEVTTAIPMTEDIRTKVMNTANGLVNGTIELIEKIDPSITGGYVLKAGDKMIDQSVATKFRRLKREFAENPYISEM